MTGPVGVGGLLNRSREGGILYRDNEDILCGWVLLHQGNNGVGVGSEIDGHSLGDSKACVVGVHSSLVCFVSE